MERQTEHHLTDALLMAYAAGSLTEAFSLVVAAHVSLCDECRVRLEAFEALGGTLLDDCDEEVPDDEALETCLARIETGTLPKVAPPRRKGVFPAPLQDYVGGDLDAVRWRSVGGGVRQAVLETEGEGSVRLLSIPAGKAVPEHSHSGLELTLVLQGAFEDEGGRFARGDVEVADDEVDHQPVACEGEDCICLAATEAPLRFHGILPRIAQPFLRI